MKKKTKRYAGGGLSGIADTANSLIGEVDGMANTIKYGSEAGSSRQTLGFNAINSPNRRVNASVDPTAISFPVRSNNTYNSTTTADPSSAFNTFSNMLSGQKTFKKGGKVSSASKRADGIAIKGKTRA